MGDQGQTAAKPRRDRVAARIFLGIAALIYLYFGTAFLIAPESMTAGIDMTLRSPTAVTDVRATYGGLEIALGIFVAVCALVPRMLATGLLVTAFSVAGFAFGRGVGLLIDAPGGLLHAGFFGLELSATTVGVVLLLRLRRSQRAAAS